MVRDLRAKRKGLNPRKVIFIYLAAFLLVAFHQSGRVAEWFDDQGASSQGWWSDAAFSVSAFIHEHIESYGPARMNQEEDALLNKYPDIIVGARADETALAVRRTPALQPPVPDIAPDPQAVLEDVQSPAATEAAEETAVTDASGTVEAEGLAGPEGPVTAEAEILENTEAVESESVETASAVLPEGAETEAAEESSETEPTVADEKQERGQTVVTAEAVAPEDFVGPVQPDEVETAVAALNPSSVLLLGDSMMLEGLGPPLERRLKKHEGLTVNRTGRYGTGLCRLDVFDWLKYFDENLDKYKPELVIITLGANDPQDIVNAPGRKKRVHLGTDEWNELYSGRVTELLAMAEKKGAHVLWVGLPIMGREPYGTRVASINQVVKEACEASPNGIFWDAWLSVANDNGKYTVQLKDSEGKVVRIRAKDSIHLTEKGGEIMADKFMEETSGWVNYQQEGITYDAETEATEGAFAPAAGDGGEVFAPLMGEIKEHKFHSAIRNKETAYFVAYPHEAIASNTRLFPTIFLLHGAWDGHNSWVENIGREKMAALAQSRQVILIMPDGEPFGWYLDGPDCAVETYLMTELLPKILTELPADRKRLAIGGLSMGGHGALTLAMKYPGTFKAVSSLSGVMDLTAHADDRKLNRSLNIHKVLGEHAESGDLWLKSCARGMTEADPKVLKGLPVMLSVGLEDNLTLEENRHYHKLLTDMKIPHVYQENPGGHNWQYWAEYLPEHIEFLAKNLGADH